MTFKKGQVGNYIRVPAIFGTKLQPGDGMQMATMPLAYVAAVYAFDHIAHLRKAQTVLIQPAANDVRLTSIRFAMAKGADVFAMVETLEKASFLVVEMAISASHII